MVVEIIGTIIFGAVIGVLARLVLPGRQNISALVTVILGVLGALIGYWLWRADRRRRHQRHRLDPLDHQHHRRSCAGRRLHRVHRPLRSTHV